MTCPNCGAQVAGSKCEYCGTEFENTFNEFAEAAHDIGYSQQATITSYKRLKDAEFQTGLILRAWSILGSLISLGIIVFIITNIIV